jgi:hypothetical protein
MGLGYCSKCGSLQGGALACPHVVAAARSGAPRFDAELRRYGYADSADLGLIYPVTFCRSCIDRLGLPPDGAYASEAVVDAACGEAECVCGVCLRRWFSAPDAELVAAPDRPRD